MKASEKFRPLYEAVVDALVEQGEWTRTAVEREARLFFDSMAVQDYYFESCGAEAVRRDVAQVLAASALDAAGQHGYFPVIHTSNGHDVFLMTSSSLAERKASTGYALERELEHRYLYPEVAQVDTPSAKTPGCSPEVSAEGARTPGARPTVPGLQSLADWEAPSGCCWRLASFRSEQSKYTSRPAERVRTYVLRPAAYPGGSTEAVYGPVGADPLETDLRALLDENCARALQGRKSWTVYERVNEMVVADATGQKLIVLYEKRNDGYRLDIGYRRSKVGRFFFSFVGDCLCRYGLFSTEKYLEPLANGVTVLTCFLGGAADEALMQRLVRTVKLQYILPPAASLLTERRGVSVHEAAYAVCAAHFVAHMTATVGRSFGDLERLAQNFGRSFESLGLLVTEADVYALKQQLRAQPRSLADLCRVAEAHPHMLRLLFMNFRFRTHPDSPGFAQRGAADESEARRAEPRPEHVDLPRYDGVDLRGYEGYNKGRPFADKLPELERELERLPEMEKTLYKWFLVFNENLCGTNFWIANKCALSFQLRGDVLSLHDYPKMPYRIILVVGQQFVGFHVRFHSIARGGLRVVLSHSEEQMRRNWANAFGECYTLAFTQEKKNKDIPESGSKGVVLLTSVVARAAAQTNATRNAFKAYVDAMLDLLAPGRGAIRDAAGQIETVYCGPDEHTGVGDLMGWAAGQARARQYQYWRAFTTGKAPARGGIPHDIFGMTTASVDEYVRQYLLLKGYVRRVGAEASPLKADARINAADVYGELELAKDVTRVQIAGPDGDLGSNALKVSLGRTIAIVDQSGVLYDPRGLERRELLRLVKRRAQGLPTSAAFYSKELLTQGAFYVGIGDENVTLPTGERVPSGLAFRDRFFAHPLATATVFNPCGGRPSTITPAEVPDLFHNVGGQPDYTRPKFELIVEGANSFVTPDARKLLEAHGIALFKDASANKGGVTSSSYEVLAALSLPPALFQTHLMCPPANPADSNDIAHYPQAYRAYTAEIVGRVRANARAEFHALWKEGERTGKPRSVLTDVLSERIIALKQEILANSQTLFTPKLVEKVLETFLPDALCPGLVSVPQFLEAVPQAHTHAVVACYLASRFYYTQPFTSEPSPFAFMQFVDSIQNKA